MITKEMVLMGRTIWENLSDEERNNISFLVLKMNFLLAEYNRPVKVNDGWRRPQDKPRNGSATSWHYKGAAIDLDDDDAGTFWAWLNGNLSLLKIHGLWIEDPRWTHGNGSWIHFQIYPPKSGKRIFIPSSKPASAPNLWDGKYNPAMD